MEEPFIMLARRYFGHAFWHEPRTYSRAEAWLDCVQLATIQPRKTLVLGTFIDVPRGGIVASERFLSDRWKWSRTKVRTFLDLLESANMVKRPRKDQDITLILLCNYEKYNSPKKPPKDQVETREEPPWNQIEKRKESKKEEGGPPCPDDSAFIADLAGLDRAQALGLLQQHFPDRDIWGNWLSFKKARQEQGRKPDWKGLIAWLRKAAPIADLGRRKPTLSLEAEAEETPISLEEQKPLAGQLAEHRKAAGI